MGEKIIGVKGGLRSPSVNPSKVGLMTDLVD